MLLLPQDVATYRWQNSRHLQDVGHKRPPAFALVWLRKPCSRNAIDLSAYVYRYPYLLPRIALFLSPILPNGN